ncbi:hypothetical protein C8J57DRAFT_1530766 [Mycena rebaudengoi]|nr:hypothetical protein C8J57DRAFT_1530766 [Mycena rebaudengoi]
MPTPTPTASRFHARSHPFPTSPAQQPGYLGLYDLRNQSRARLHTVSYPWLRKRKKLKDLRYIGGGQASHLASTLVDAAPGGVFSPQTPLSSQCKRQPSASTRKPLYQRNVKHTLHFILAVDEYPIHVLTAEVTAVSYSWDGAATHEPKNISFELMVGKVEDNGNEVADIIEISNSGFSSSTVSSESFFDWHVRAATPPGDYHIRMNATIYEEDGGPIGPFTQRSQSFSVVQKAFECTIPAWEPAHWRGSLLLGDCYHMRTMTPVSYSIGVVDDNFKVQDASITLELVNTRTGASAGAQTLIEEDFGFSDLDMNNFKIEVGPWKACNTLCKGSNFMLTCPKGPRKIFGAWKHQLFGLVVGKSTTSGGSGGSGALTSIAFSAFLLGMVPAIAISATTL